MRSLLGPIAKRMTEPRLTKARRLFFSLSDKSAAPDPIAPSREKSLPPPEAILNVINSSPRTPSSQELTEILQKELVPQKKVRPLRIRSHEREHHPARQEQLAAQVRGGRRRRRQAEDALCYNQG